jgi:hypothetical protein
VEGIIEDQIMFGSFSDTSRYKLFTPENAKFKVVERESGNKNYFELIQLEQ